MVGVARVAFTAGVAGVAFTAGVAGVAFTAGVAGVAFTAGVAGVAFTAGVAFAVSALARPANAPIDTASIEAKIIFFILVPFREKP